VRNNNLRGRDIRRGAVRSSDVRNNALRGRDVGNDTIGGADVVESTLARVPSALNAVNAQNAANAQAALNAQTLGGKSAAAFLGSDAQRRTGLIRLAQGQAGAVASSGPFTWRAQCVDDGGDSRLIVTLATSEAGSFAGDFGGGGQPVSPGTPVEVFNETSPTPVYTIGFPLSAVAPSGAAPVGLGFVGIDVVGADCVVNGVLWK
jgi:hypothetical protein